MANEFYQRSQKDVMGVTQTAVAGPNMKEAFDGNARKTQSIINGLDSLVNLGAGAIKAGDRYAKKQTAKAVIEGQTKAIKGEARPESQDFWSGDAQQQAYDDVRGEGSVADLPDYVNRHMANNKEIKKPLDEMSREERQGWMVKARSDFFKERKLDESPYRLQAEAHANTLLSKQMDVMDQQAIDLRDGKAQANVSSLVSNTVNAFGGSPVEIDAVIGADIDKYKQSLGDPMGEKTNGAIVTGLLQSVMSPQPNLKTLDYLRSPEAEARFGHMDGFAKAIKQANDFSLKAQNAEAVKVKAGAENEFYGLLNVGGFTSQEEVQNQLDTYPDSVLDQGEKFTLMNKAMSHMRASGAADNLQAAIGAKNFGVVNAAKQEDLVASFERNVMSKSDDIDAVLNAQADANDPATASQNAFTKWVQEGYNVPTYVKEHFNSPINAGNTRVWDNRLATYQRMSQRLGATGVGKLYDSETQAGLDEYAALTADVVMKPEDKKQALTNFIEGAKRDRITGISTNYGIRKEIMDEDKGILSTLQQFAAEGGGDTTVNLNVPSDLQPFTTMRSNSDTSVGGYAVKSLAGNYSVYRRQNPNAEPEVALRKAKNDFLSQNLWVDWSDKSTYVPREFGSDFAVRGMDYVRDSGIISKLSITEGLPPEVIERKITIEPSSDYHSSRKMSVFYDGIEQAQKFNLQQFDKKIGLLSAQERQKIERENSDLRNSPEYKAKQEKLMKFQNSLGAFGFGMN
jgi:hypothetical protein